MQPLRLQKRIHVVHADAVDKDVGSGVVADSDHHGRKVAQRNLSDAGRQPAHDVAVLNQVGGVDRIKVGQLQLALLGLAVEFGKHADLDRASLRENVVGVQQIFVPVGEIDNGDAHDPVEIAIDIENGFFQLHPEDLLLLGGRRRRSLSGRGSAQPETNRRQQSRDCFL